MVITMVMPSLCHGNTMVIFAENFKNIKYFVWNVLYNIKRNYSLWYTIQPERNAQTKLTN